MKSCTKCGMSKSVDDFMKKSKSRGGGPSSWCKDCSNASSRRYRSRNYEKCREKDRKWKAKNYSHLRFLDVSRNASRKGMEVMPRAEFIAWYDSSEKFCHYCGIYEPLSKERHRENLGIDRKNNDVGYLKDNVVLACKPCNSGKSNIFSYGEWIEIASKYISPRYQKPVFEDCTI